MRIYDTHCCLCSGSFREADFIGKAETKFRLSGMVHMRCVPATALMLGIVIGVFPDSHVVVSQAVNVQRVL